VSGSPSKFLQLARVLSAGAILFFVLFNARADEIAPGVNASSRKLTETGPGELISDRPDYTESAEVVRLGWVQMESGFGLERSLSTGGSTLTLGTPLLRVGLGRRFELRLGSDGVVGDRATSGEGHSFGRAHSEVGFKYKIADEGRFRPSFAVIAAVSTPTGSSEMSSNAYEPGVKFAWAKELPRGFSVAGNLNLSALAIDGGRMKHKEVTLSVAHDLPAGFGGYWEVYGLSGVDRGERNSYVFLTGVTRMIGPDAQWDASFGHRLTRQGPDYLATFGFAIRRPVGWLSGL